MDSLNELQDALEQKRLDLEDSRESLELERHRLREAAELSLKDERSKMDEEKLRVQNLACELQAAMDKITLKKTKKPKYEKVNSLPEGVTKGENSEGAGSGKKSSSGRREGTPRGKRSSKGSNDPGRVPPSARK